MDSGGIFVVANGDPGKFQVKLIVDHQNILLVHFLSTSMFIIFCENRKVKVALSTLAASRAMLIRLDQSSCCAKAGVPRAFFSTSYRDPLAQNSVTMQGGSRHKPMNITTFGCRRAAMIDTCRSKSYEARAQLCQDTSDSTVAQILQGYWRLCRKCFETVEYGRRVCNSVLMNKQERKCVPAQSSILRMATLYLSLM